MVKSTNRRPQRQTLSPDRCHALTPAPPAQRVRSPAKFGRAGSLARATALGASATSSHHARPVRALGRSGHLTGRRPTLPLDRADEPRQLPDFHGIAMGWRGVEDAPGGDGRGLVVGAVMHFRVKDAASREVVEPIVGHFDPDGLIPPERVWSCPPKSIHAGLD